MAVRRSPVRVERPGFTPPYGAQMTHPPSEHEHSADIAGVEIEGIEGG